jgi:uncharacterized protein (DUF2062 family)
MVSNPITFPLLVVAELKLGEVLLGTSSISVEELMAGRGWSLAGEQLLVGTAILASSVGVVGAALAWAVARHWQQRRLRREADLQRNGA